MAILSYKNRATEDIAKQFYSKKALKLLPINLHGIAYRKLILLDNAADLIDLIGWKSLRLEKLSGNRAGQYSMRINQQYRICFFWKNNNAEQVEITDYH